MAIVKEYIGDSMSSGITRKVAAFLNAHAVPKYFDEVEDSGKAVSCKIGDRFALTIDYSANIVIAHSSGTVRSENSAAGWWAYAWACNGGIAFGYGTDASFAFCITKDSNGNTVVIDTDGLVLPTADTSQTVRCISLKSITSSGIKVYSRSGEKTVMSPMLVEDTSGSYTPTAFLMTYAQYTTPATLDIDGIKYLSNGIWCLQDE